MNFKIDFDLINKILNLTDIVEIIRSKIDLTKRGEYYFSLCPFHKEKNPSFFVNKNKKFYYCFGCKSYGNIINFLMNFHKYNFIDAIKELSEINNIKLNFFIKNNKKNLIDKNLLKLYNLMKLVCNIYKNNLLKFNNVFVNKYVKNKNWTLSTIKNFSIGYSSKDLIFNYIKKYKNNLYFLIKLGILHKKNDNYIDMFSNRIIFPIYDDIGNIIAFGGRSINDIFKPKYINSLESLIFKKKCCLYGLYQVKKIYNYNIPQLLLVEGYTDVISLFNLGINYAISILGSYLHESQILTLFKYTNKIIFCYDGDITGYSSSIKSFNKILPYITDDRQINFIILPKNEDPDSFIKKIGLEKFNDLIIKSIDISEFLFNYIFKYDLSIISNKIFIIKEYIKLINLIPGKLIKFFLKKKLCFKLNINFDELNYILYENKENKNILSNKNVFKKYNPICIGINMLIKNPLLYKLINIPL